MIGLDSYIGTKQSFVGVDFLNLASGAFKTAGGALAPGAAGSAPPDAAEKARLEEQKKAAEQSAATWKKVGVVALIAAALGGVFWYRHRS